MKLEIKGKKCDNKLYFDGTSIYTFTPIRGVMDTGMKACDLKIKDKHGKRVIGSSIFKIVQISSGSWLKESVLLIAEDGVYTIKRGMLKKLYEHEDLKILSASGKRDIRGQEIYDGDILMSESGYSVLLVQYHKGSYRCRDLTQPEKDINLYGSFLTNTLECARYKVIGNYIDTPQIMGAGKYARI